MKKIFILLFTITVLGGCASTQEDVLGTSKSQVQTRNYQSRAYDTSDVDMVLRSVISTMLDLGFIVDKADSALGTVTGRSYENDSTITVSVRKKGATQTIVRINAQHNLKTIEDPIAYQNFFKSLSQSLFLTANNVD